MLNFQNDPLYGGGSDPVTWSDIFLYKASKDGVILYQDDMGSSEEWVCLRHPSGRVEYLAPTKDIEG